MLSEIPEHTIFIILYTVPVYFMSGLHLDAGRFFQTFAMLFAIVYCSRSMAMWAGSLMPTYPMSVLLAQTIFTVFLLSCGFIFNLENIFVGEYCFSSCDVVVSFKIILFQFMCVVCYF